MIRVGDKVRLRKPARKVHPWRRNRLPYVGEGVVLDIQEVQESSWVTDGKIYIVLWRNKERKMTIKEISLLTNS